jgi:excisionase family DNA binding protein
VAQRANAADELMDVRHAAKLVARHPETIRRWVWSGRLGAQRRGNRLLVARAELEALAGQGGASISLREWANRARAARASTPAAGPPRTAADLVLEDRKLRSKAAASHACR